MALIAIVGMAGSGKSEVTKIFLEQGYDRIHFGSITIDLLKEKGLEVNEPNERKIREGLRKELGMAAYAIKNIPNIKQKLEKNENLILDGLYSWEEYLELKNEFPLLIVLAVYSSPKTRYSRLSLRETRPLTKAEANSRDHSEIENLHKAGPIAMADYTIVNEGDIVLLKASLEKIISHIDVLNIPHSLR